MSKPRFGWVPPEKRDYSTAKSHDKILESTRVMSAAGHAIRDSGAGKTVLLHKFLEKINGGTFPVNRQTIGDCVSHGWAKGIEVLMAVEILLKGEQEDWPAVLTATEWIYGTSRVLVGGGRLGNGDGSLGSWAAKAVQEHGTLLRKQYGSTDLSKYSGQRAKEWGYRGLPSNELEPIADEHPVKTCAMVASYEEARDAIANGYPVPVCSNQGFASSRDSQGFAKPSGSWAHCMLFMAVDDGQRPGLLCMNSWGPDWISGPKRHDQPEGSFWVDAETCDRMLRGRDSYAISNFSGYPARDIDHNPFT